MLIFLLIIQAYLYDWIRTYGMEDRTREMNSLGFDGSGNVYISGWSDPLFTSDAEEEEYEVAFAKMDMDGNNSYIMGMYNDYLDFYTVDMTIWEDGRVGFLGRTDTFYALLEMDEFGVETSSLEIESFVINRVEKVEEDNGYFVIGSGITCDPARRSCSSGEDILVWKIDETLSPEWKMGYNYVNAAENDYGVSIIPSDDGNFYMGGVVHTETNKNMTISKVNGYNGEIIFSFEFGSEDIEVLNDICLLSDGSFGFVGQTPALSLSKVGIVGRVSVNESGPGGEPEASLIWAKYLSLEEQHYYPRRCVGGADESFFVVSSNEFAPGGRRTSMAGPNGHVSKFSGNGTTVFAKTSDYFANGNDIGVNPVNGDVYVVGESTTGPSYFARLSPDGIACPNLETDLEDFMIGGMEARRVDSPQYSENTVEFGIARRDLLFFDPDYVGRIGPTSNLYLEFILDGEYGSVYEVNDIFPQCFSCYSKWREDPYACNSDLGFGECVAEDTCVCAPGWDYPDPQCSTTTCFGFLNNSTDTCYGNGNCTDYNLCECASAYFGPSCNVTFCYGIMSNSSGYVCGGHGSCYRENVCQCWSDWYGVDCNVTSCFGVFSNDTKVACAGKGTCSSMNECECEEGYFGENCNVTKCGDIFSNHSSVCNSRGDCWPKDVCNCDKNWYGDGKCDITICHGIWTNDSVNEESLCSDRGVCYDFDRCECNTNFYGKTCNVTRCFGVWSNETSEVLCSGHGSCIGTHCVCGRDHFGDVCNITHCGGILANESNVCKGHGDCVDTNECICYEEWYFYPGTEACNVTSCNGIYSNNTVLVCNKGNGTCVSPDHCECIPRGEFAGDNCDVCAEGFYGSDCEIVSCYNVLSNYSDGITDQLGREVCSGHGTCEYVDECVCFDYSQYDGVDCGIHLCYEVSSLDDSVCGKKGSCTSLDNCDCDNGYHGSECLEKFEAPYFTNKYRNVLEIPYYVLQQFMDSQKPQIREGERFNCSKIVKNWNQFLIYNSSYCQFIFLEVHGTDYLLSQKLVIQILDLELYDGKKVKGVDRRKVGEEKEALPDYEIPDNYTIELISVTPPESKKMLKVYVLPYIEPEDDQGEDNSSKEIENSFLWAAITFPGAFVGFVAFVIIVVVLTCLVCCICCCIIFCIIGLTGGVVIKKNLDQRKGLSKFGKLRNFDLLMKEQEMDDDQSTASIKINKVLFEIDMDEVQTISVLGEGGSNSTVYKAEWAGKLVAFKCFKTRNLMSTQDRFDEFECEVQILSSVSHPNIIQFYGACLKPPRVGILMEFCTKGELLEYVIKYRDNEKNEALPLHEKIRLIMEAAGALEYLHARNVIHRDLKCENVLISQDVSSKLMDFGLSRCMESMSAQKTSRIGTNVYMAPEVLGGHYDETIDVFSLAIMTYVVVREEANPYVGTDHADMFQIEFKVANDPKFRPDLTKLELSEENEWLVKLIRDCWDHDPTVRYSMKKIRSMMVKKRKEMLGVPDEEEEEKVSKPFDLSSILSYVPSTTTTTTITDDDVEVVPASEPPSQPSHEEENEEKEEKKEEEVVVAEEVSEEKAPEIEIVEKKEEEEDDEKVDQKKFKELQEEIKRLKEKLEVYESILQ